MRLLNMPLKNLIKDYPFVKDFFSENRLNIKELESLSFCEYLNHLSEEYLEDNAIDIERLPHELEIFIEQMLSFLGIEKENEVNSLTILPGKNKLGEPEIFERIEILPSQIISVVGPTGSGKSRLLADIEWAAQGDTPTGRSILIDGTKAETKWRYSAKNKLVAQLSQNMNFVIDLSVGEFLQLHSQCRMTRNAEETIALILDEANKLAGEAFSIETPVTSLSGGQSRALMIADTAILSSSPIVLIDEIENAGIDRRKALELLVSKDKIVIMATHDPLLALMANSRIVIKNGGIHSVLDTTTEEKKLLTDLSKLDKILQAARQKLRVGGSLCREEILCKV